MKWLKSNIFSLLSVLALPIIGWALALQVQSSVLADDVEELDAQVEKIETIKDCIAEQGKAIAEIAEAVRWIKDDIKEIKESVKPTKDWSCQ